MQRVNEASFFEVTTSRSCEDVSGFHNVTFGKNILLSVLVRFLVSTFESFLGFREFFPRLSGIFFKRAREPEGKLRHVVTKFDWSVISSSRSKYGTFENE